MSPCSDTASLKISCERDILAIVFKTRQQNIDGWEQDEEQLQLAERLGEVEAHTTQTVVTITVVVVEDGEVEQKHVVSFSRPTV